MTLRTVLRIAKPTVIGVLVGAVQAGCYAGFIYYTQLGSGRQSDTGFGNWHLEAQLFWLSALLVASLSLIYVALRHLHVRYAVALVLPVVVVEFAVGAFIASKLSGPVDLRTAVLPAILAVELVGLTSLPGLVAGQPVPRSGEDGAARPAQRHRASAVADVGEPIGIGLLIDTIQFALLFFVQIVGAYEPPANLLRLHVDRPFLWFVSVVGGSSIVMVYLALKHLDVPSREWLAVATVVMQIGLVAVFDTHVATLGRLHAVLSAAVLPVELVVLSLWLGRKPTRRS